MKLTPSDDGVLSKTQIVTGKRLHHQHVQVQTYNEREREGEGREREGKHIINHRQNVFLFNILEWLFC